MDMWKPYKDAVQLVLPDAKIVIDKFHVVRMANDALETIRKQHRSELTARERKTLLHDRYVLRKRRNDLSDKEYLNLSGWTANYPLLGAAYDTKEAFYDMWDLTDRTDAENAFQRWNVSG